MSEPSSRRSLPALILQSASRSISPPISKLYGHYDCQSPGDNADDLAGHACLLDKQ